MDMNLFLEVERKYGLLNDTVEGLYYWNLNRFDIFQYRIVEKQLALGAAHSGKKKTVADKIIHKIKLWYYSNFFDKIPRKNVDVCFVNHPRRVKRNNVYECIYTEKLSQLFPNSVVVEKPYLDGHLRPVKTSNLLYTDKISVKALKDLDKIKKTPYYENVKKSIHEKLKEPLTELAKLYAVDINIQKTVDFCTEKTILCALKKPYFKERLKKINPKAIVEVVYYNRDCMVINEVAKEMGIPVIELQHGTMGELHNAYQFAKKTDFYHLPDRILTFSEYWNDIINIPQKDNRAVAVGYPFFEEQIQKYKKEKKYSEEIKTVIFVSQGTVGEKLSRFAVEVAEYAKGKIRIIYKLHPSEYARWKTQYAYLAHPSIEVVDNNQKSIYEYFAQADAQVGVYSTAIYEGMAFELKTYIYDMAMADTMYRLCESGYAMLIKTPEEMMADLSQNDIVKKDANTFWKENAISHMQKIIQEYIKG